MSRIYHKELERLRQVNKTQSGGTGSKRKAAKKKPAKKKATK